MKLSRENGLGLCLCIYLATDAINTLDMEMNDVIQKFIAGINKISAKTIGLDVKVPELITQPTFMKG